MPTPIESKEAGLTFEIPDITQAQLEQFFRAERGVRRSALTEDGALLTNVSDIITQAVREAQKQSLAPSGPEMAALVQGAARKAIGVVAKAQADAEITELEQSGAYARAAARLGWLTGITETDVADWRPGIVSWLVGKLAEVIAKARAIPKN
jgi:hypothetical protein